MDNIKFPCTACGSCCKRIKIVVENLDGVANNEENLLYFPYKWDETGKCEMLGDDNKCKVYDKRPLLCNVEAVALLLKLDRKDFYKTNAEVCNRLMDEDNIPAELRINLEEL